MKHAYLIIAGLVGLMPAAASAVAFGPSPYLCFDSATTTATGSCAGADSPFNSLSFSYFHLEDFTDHLLNTPGVTETNGAIIASTGFGGSIIDSVDEDDGAIDGSGNGPLGDSMWNSGAVIYQFNAAVLGNLPTHVGLVWTDGNGANTTFSAFDVGGALIGQIVANVVNDGNFGGGTAEDRFFGFSGIGSIASISMSNSGPIEVDHLQYGYMASTTPPPGGGVPAPVTLALLGLGLAGLGYQQRKQGKVP